MKFIFAPFFIPMIQASHKSAHLMTAQLSTSKMEATSVEWGTDLNVKFCLWKKLMFA